MTTLSPWINFNGNAEEAFSFYQSVLGGTFTNIMRFKDMASPESPVSEQEADKVMRIVLTLEGGAALIGNDVPSFMGSVSENENRSKIHVAAGSREEAARVADGLSVGGQVEVPLGEGSFAMFRDRYGIEWIVEVGASA